MSLNGRVKLNRIEELKGRLFSKNYQTKLEHRDKFTHLNRKETPDVWANREEDTHLSYSGE